MDTKAEHSATATEEAPSRPGLPQFATDHAPVFHLHTEDDYHPSSIRTFLDHTSPQIDFKDVRIQSPPLTLNNLSQLNKEGSNEGKDIYLTSLDDVTVNPVPEWLKGVSKIDPAGGTNGDQTGSIIVVEKGKGVVDVFYFIFFAFNFGGIVLGKNLGNHVGDWEHAMIRFIDGKPKYVWLSQHSNGEAYAFTALEKTDAGKRPVLYIAKGSHAIYAKTGAIDHTIPNFNTELPFLLVDYCDKGPKLDPLLTSHAYSYTPEPKAVTKKAPKSPNPTDTIGTFKELTPHSAHPDWLLFRGHWGDKQYKDDDPRQQGLLSFHKFSDGPTGPAFKDLGREKVWPANSHAWGQRIRTSLDGRTALKDVLAHWGWTCLGVGKAGFRVKGKPTRVDVSGNPVERAES